MNNDFNEYEDFYTPIPTVALRGLVVFPKMAFHFDVGRKKSIEALNEAMATNQTIFLVAQRDSSVDDPSIDDLFEIGVVCSVKKLIKIPNSRNIRVIVEGVKRGYLAGFDSVSPYLIGQVNVIDDQIYAPSSNDIAMRRALKNAYENYVKLTSPPSNEVLTRLISIEEIGELADFICAHTMNDYLDKQDVLNIIDPRERIEKMLKMLSSELLTINLENDIQEKVNAEIEKGQEEYYLREKMKVIADKLGDAENPIDEAEEYRKTINALSVDAEVKQKLLKEADKLMKMPNGSHEATVVRTYLDKCLEIPFGKYTKDSIKLSKSKKILDADHYGLDEVKTRIVETLAVLKRNASFSGQIICLYGPPGVGKTSIVKSLAKSMNRKYVRVALGGVHDEAEIRGHRKTYIGSMPGRIIDAIIKSGVMNPIVLLDEIDKIGADYKGDPSSALLEALDPEQNSSFNDHYIDFPVDLSKVLFITTANDVSTIASALYDRMEVIELNSYSVEEKFNIAKKHLIKKELAKHNLSSKELKIADSAIYKIIECYTREAGVRRLERQIATICRKALVQIDEGKKSVKVTDKNITDFLGIEKYSKDSISSSNLVGTVNGLAWTSVGGTMLPIEVAALDGTGKIELTGNLGDVMKESAKTAVSFIRSRAEYYGIDKEFYKTKDIHIHAPEAATPKDGPSAGLAITTAIVSELTGVPINHNIAMTGEVSLKGNALPIGGLKEKSMAAYKAGCDTVIIPMDNKKDLAEISDEVKNAVTFRTVSTFDEVVDIALEYRPKAVDNKSIIVENKSSIANTINS